MPDDVCIFQQMPFGNALKEWQSVTLCMKMIKQLRNPSFCWRSGSLLYFQTTIFSFKRNAWQLEWRSQSSWKSRTLVTIWKLKTTFSHLCLVTKTRTWYSPTQIWRLHFCSWYPLHGKCCEHGNFYSSRGLGGGGGQPRTWVSFL